jgi:hypothetical protein
LNLFAYARNNPVNLTDPTGLDVALKCDTQANCNKAVQDFNGRKGAQFKVELGKDGKLHAVKGSVAKNLSKAEGALLGAVNDSQNHATINVSGNTGQSEFGVHDNRGVNSVDLENLSELDAPSNAGGLNSGDALAHEAMDAYYSLSMGAEAADWAAADLFPGLPSIYADHAHRRDRNGQQQPHAAPHFAFGHDSGHCCREERLQFARLWRASRQLVRATERSCVEQSLCPHFDVREQKHLASADRRP